MKFGPTKLSYLITFGLTPYLRSYSWQNCKKYHVFFSYEESLNQELQQKQMDFTVKYFKEDEVNVAILHPFYFGHIQAEVLKKFKGGTQRLGNEENNTEITAQHV